MSIYIFDVRSHELLVLGALKKATDWVDMIHHAAIRSIASMSSSSLSINHGGCAAQCR